MNWYGWKRWKSPPETPEQRNHRILGNLKRRKRQLEIELEEVGKSIARREAELEAIGGVQ